MVASNAATTVDNERQWEMNGVVAGTLTEYAAPDLTADPQTGLEVTLTPRGRGFSALNADDELVITYTGMGIVNPSTAAPGLKVSAVTSVADDVAVTSAEFAIEVPNSPADVVVTNSPRDPGAAAEYTITFVTAARLEAGTGQIILDIDSSIGVPTSLSPSAVRIRANDIDGATVTDVVDSGTTIKKNCEAQPEQAPGLGSCLQGDPRHRRSQGVQDPNPQHGRRSGKSGGRHLGGRNRHADPAGQLRVHQPHRGQRSGLRRRWRHSRLWRR